MMHGGTGFRQKQGCLGRAIFKSTGGNQMETKKITDLNVMMYI